MQVVELKVKSSPNLIKVVKKSEFVKPWQPENFSGVRSIDVLNDSVAFNANVHGSHAEPVNVNIADFQEEVHEEISWNSKNLIPSRQQAEKIHQWAPLNLSKDAEKTFSPDTVPQIHETINESNLFEKEWGKKLEEVRVQAEDIINSTRKKVTDLVREAESRVDQIHGLARTEGMEEGKKEALEVMNKIGTIVNETQVWRKQVLEESENVIIEIIQSIAKKLFGNGFVLEPTTVEQMVARAISEASRLGNLRVYLNPEDEISLISLWQDSELTVNGQKIQLVPSQNILRGGCFIEGEFGSVDGRADIQLNLINDELTAMVTNEVGEVVE